MSSEHVDIFRRQSVAVVLPCYRVKDAIEEVIRGLPAWIKHVVAVDDACPEGSGEVLDRLEGEIDRLTVVHHEVNQGVGGAMVTGFRAALTLDADIFVKMDGDGQMDPGMLAPLLVPLLEGRGGYAKGNRFRAISALSQMPRMRLFGNVALTFLTRLASGYWHVFDPQNGYIAITRSALENMPLEKIDKTYFFENSMLVHLNMENVPVVDVSMPAIYGDEQSSLRIGRILMMFPPKLVKSVVKRVFFKYFVYDVSPIAPYLLVGLTFVLFGISYGGFHWWRSLTTGGTASTGTVMLALLPFLIGFELLIHSISMDMSAEVRPRQPLRLIHPDDVPNYVGDPATSVEAADPPTTSTARR